MSLQEDIEKWYNIGDPAKDYQLFKEGKIVVHHIDDTVGDTYTFIYCGVIYEWNCYLKKLFELENENPVKLFFRGVDRINFNISKNIDDIIYDLSNGKKWRNFKCREGKNYRCTKYNFFNVFGQIYVRESEVSFDVVFKEVVYFLLKDIGKIIC